MKIAKATYLALLITCILLSSISAVAQTSTSGNIEGTVVDFNGAVVPNATVVLNGPTLIRPQSSTSNEDGVYRFLAVPPGKYSVKIEASADYDKFERTDVEISISKMTTLDITLNPKGEKATPEAPSEENQKPAPKEGPAAAVKSKYSVAELTIRERQADGVTILDLEGRITGGGGATALRNAIRGLLDDGKKKILLNCKGVSHVDEDGIGIGAMVAGYNAAKAEDSQLKLSNLPPFLKDVLAITKLITVFDTYADEAEALNSFK